MEELFRTLIEEAGKTSLLEWAAFISSLLYIGLASRENSLCWYPAMFASILFMILFIEADLYMKIPLRVYYLIMAFYGLYEWRKGGKGGASLPIRSLPVPYHILGISACALLGLGAGYMMDAGYGMEFLSKASLPYLDSLTTIFSLFTTFLVARKYLANWYYWIVIDGVSVYLYGSQGLYLTSLLFILFTVLAIWGAFVWNARYFREQA